MRIENLRRERHANATRVTARLTWEDSDRNPLEVFFETGAPFAEGLTCNPDAFLIAGIVPALRHGESRIAVEGEVSPELLDGLPAVMAVLRHWFRPESKLVTIEAMASSSTLTPRPAERAGFFLSGGVDSLAALRGNRLRFPPDHPGSIKDGLLVFGLEVERPDAFELAQKAVAELAKDSGVELVPVSTNVRHLDDDWFFYRDEFQGAILAAIGHAFARRLTVLSIAATCDVRHLGPWGSHPLLDPNFTTSNLRVHHADMALSRLDKVRLLLEWPAALDRMRVCNQAEFYRPGMLNCGQCEKCVRTMLELIALGALDRCGAFPKHDVSEEVAAKAGIHDDYVQSCYTDMIEPLAQRGRHDLVRGVERALANYRGETGWTGPMKRFDRLHLNGALRTAKRALRPAATHNGRY